MTLLAGTKTEAGGTAVARTTELGLAQQVECTVEGVVEELGLDISVVTGSGTNFRAALYNDNGSNQVGTKVEERAKGSGPATGENVVTGFSSKIIKGTKYWLLFEMIGGTSFKWKPNEVTKSTTVAKSTPAATKSATLEAMSWASAVSEGPIGAWASGKEESVGKLESKTTVKVATTAPLAATATLASKSTVVFKTNEVFLFSGLFVPVKAGKWNTASTWKPERAPSETDEINLNGFKEKIEVNASSKCRCVEASSFEGELLLKSTLNIGDASNPSYFPGVLFKFVSGKGTLTVESGAKISMSGTYTASPLGIWGGGKIWPQIEGGAEGNWALEEAIETKGYAEAGTTNGIEVRKGTFASNGYEIKTSIFDCAGTTKRTIKLGTSTVRCTAQEGTVGKSVNAWNTNNGGVFTYDFKESTIEVVGGGTGVSVFVGSSQEYNNVTLGRSTEMTCTPTGATNTLLGTLRVNTAATATGGNIEAKLLKNAKKEMEVTSEGTLGKMPKANEVLFGKGIPNGTFVEGEPVGNLVVMSKEATETVSVAETVEVGVRKGLIMPTRSTVVQNFTTNGKATELATLRSSEYGSQASLGILPPRKVEADYLRLRDSIVQEQVGTSWYAGSHSENLGNNTNWKFEAGPGELPGAKGKITLSQAAQPAIQMTRAMSTSARFSDTAVPAREFPLKLTTSLTFTDALKGTLQQIQLPVLGSARFGYQATPAQQVKRSMATSLRITDTAPTSREIAVLCAAALKLLDEVKGTQTRIHVGAPSKLLFEETLTGASGQPIKLASSVRFGYKLSGLKITVHTGAKSPLRTAYLIRSQREQELLALKAFLRLVTHLTVEKEGPALISIRTTLVLASRVLALTEIPTAGNASMRFTQSALALEPPRIHVQVPGMTEPHERFGRSAAHGEVRQS